VHDSLEIEHMEVKYKATAVQPFLPSRVLFCLFWGT